MIVFVWLFLQQVGNVFVASDATCTAVGDRTASCATFRGMQGDRIVIVYDGKYERWYGLDKYRSTIVKLSRGSYSRIGSFLLCSGEGPIVGVRLDGREMKADYFESQLQIRHDGFQFTEPIGMKISVTE